MLAAIESYEPPKHRCELVRERNGIEFINDSKATDLHALESCVRSLESPLVLIMGGKEKGLDYAPLRQAIPGKVRALVTIGEIGERLRQQFCDIVPCESSADMHQAVLAAARLAQPGDAVVLTPRHVFFRHVFRLCRARGALLRRRPQAFLTTLIHSTTPPPP